MPVCVSEQNLGKCLNGQDAKSLTVTDLYTQVTVLLFCSTCIYDFLSLKTSHLLATFQEETDWVLYNLHISGKLLSVDFLWQQEQGVEWFLVVNFYISCVNGYLYTHKPA